MAEFGTYDCGRDPDPDESRDGRSCPESDSDTSGSLGEDEIALEFEFGSDIWQGPQGPIADDITTLRELQRSGTDRRLFDHLAGEEYLEGLLDKATTRAEKTDLMARLGYVNPDRVYRLLDALFGPEANAVNDDEEPMTDSGTDPPVVSPRSGPEGKRRGR